MADRGGKFVHLHVHSQYSLLDGACRTGDLAKRAKELGQDTIALSDHGCLFGAVDFYAKCVAEGVKPILGMEGYMAAGDRRDRSFTGVKDGGYHLLMLAQNLEGWQNLLRLSSIAYLEGFYYKPRIDKEVLREHSAGLIVTSACLGGEIPTALTASDRKKAKAIADEYLSMFGPERFFIELQSHIAEQAAVNGELVDLAERLGIGVVATNDVHFLLPGDHGPHDALCCIATGKLVSDEQRLIYPKQLYLKSAEEMREAGTGVKRWEEACDNTVRIAEMCDVELDFGTNHAPVVKVGRREGAKALKGTNARMRVKGFKSEHAVGTTAWYKDFCEQVELKPFDSHKDGDSAEELKERCDEALRELAEAGVVWRYGAEGVTNEIRERLDRELTVLADKRISAYFLIVWDFVNEARRQGIPCAARGSGVGTMVGYCLGLSNACPVKYGLLFERFTDPDRSEYPDIDIDICQNGRGRILDYVRQKYGYVAQIITFGTLKARAVLRDVGRVLDVPLAEVDRIAKLVPGDLGMTLDKALEVEPDLRKQYQDDGRTREMIDIGRRLEGLTRHASVHAAGVVLATQPLDTIVPLYRAPGSEDVITQWDGPTCEKAGLLKMDFLGLRTLSIIQRAVDLVEATLDKGTQRRAVRGEFGAGVGGRREFEGMDEAFDPMDLDRLTYEDQSVLDLFRRGETGGVFQFESGGMRNLLMAMKPDRLADLIAANALYRPGPMDLIPEFNDRKHGRKSVPNVHEIVDRFTEETYGIMVYQEQVMQIVHHLGGIPLRGAYTLIKAISKKKEKQINASRETFIDGAVEKGLTKGQAEELFDLILKFAGYGFNKSHSTGYAIVAYQTAYLKTYFPVQYMAALLTFESVSTDKVVEYIDECRRVRFPNGRTGVDVRPPDINLSYTDFTVVYEEGEERDSNHGHIRFGLGAVKGVGAKAVGAIIEAREKGGAFRSLFDFCERVSHGVVNKAVVEALVKCGAFDALHGTDSRAGMMEAIEAAMSRGAQEAELRSSEDFLFGAVAEGDEEEKGDTDRGEPQLPKVMAWGSREKLKFEKDVLGFYVTSHPLDRWRGVIDRYSSAAVGEVRGLKAEVEVVLGGMLTRVRPTLVKNGRSAGQKMAMVTIEDRTGSIEGVIFSDGYAKHAHLIEADRIVFLTGKVDRRREEPSVVIDKVIPVEEAAEELTRSVKIVIRDVMEDGSARQVNGELSALKSMLRQSAGGCEVYLEVHEKGQVVTLSTGMRVKATAELPVRVAGILRDEKCCEMFGPRKVAGSNGAMLREGESTVVNRLERRTSEEEFCESIDRY